MRGFWADDNLKCTGCRAHWGTRAKQGDSVCLPPCHADAAKPEDVYKFEDRILLAVETPPHSPSRDVRTAVPWPGSLRMLVVP